MGFNFVLALMFLQLFHCAKCSVMLLANLFKLLLQCIDFGPGRRLPKELLYECICAAHYPSIMDLCETSRTMHQLAIARARRMHKKVIEQLEQRIADLEQQNLRIDDLERENREKDREIQERDRQIKELRKQIKELRNQLAIALAPAQPAPPQNALPPAPAEHDNAAADENKQHIGRDDRRYSLQLLVDGMRTAAMALRARALTYPLTESIKRWRKFWENQPDIIIRVQTQGTRRKSGRGRDTLVENLAHYNICPERVQQKLVELAEESGRQLNCTVLRLPAEEHGTEQQQLKILGSDESLLVQYLLSTESEFAVPLHRIRIEKE